MTILNSKFINHWYRNNFSSGLHIKINQIKQIPIPNIPFSEQQPFIEKADFMLDKNKELHEKTNKFLNRLKSSF
jgi:hypothetical protein